MSGSSKTLAYSGFSFAQISLYSEYIILKLANLGLPDLGLADIGLVDLGRFLNHSIYSSDISDVSCLGLCFNHSKYSGVITIPCGNFQS